MIATVKVQKIGSAVSSAEPLASGILLDSPEKGGIYFQRVSKIRSFLPGVGDLPHLECHDQRSQTTNNGQDAENEGQGKGGHEGINQQEHTEKDAQCA